MLMWKCEWKLKWNLSSGRGNFKWYVGTCGVSGFERFSKCPWEVGVQGDRSSANDNYTKYECIERELQDCLTKLEPYHLLLFVIFK